jgi:heptosyltransferase II
MKVVVRMPNWIGDLVMATPVLADVRRVFPEAELTALCKTPVSELLEQDESLDELFVFSKPEHTFLRRQERRNMIAKLRMGKYDLGIVLPGSFSSAWLFWQGRIKRRIGFAKGFRSLLLTDPVPLPRVRMHQVELYKELLRPLGIERSSTLPRITLSDRERMESKELLYQRGYRAGQSLIGIHPGAAYGSAKCWLPDRFAELATRLVREDPSVMIVFFGDGTSFELVKHICAQLPERVMNLSGVTSLRELACLIQDCDLLITNDSGPMHLAAAFDVPLIALFGSTDDRATGPYGMREAVIHKRVSCSPCFRRTCPIDFRCMTEISVDEVFQLALQRRRIRV